MDRRTKRLMRKAKALREVHQDFVNAGRESPQARDRLLGTLLDLLDALDDEYNDVGQPSLTPARRKVLKQASKGPVPYGEHRSNVIEYLVNAKCLNPIHSAITGRVKSYEITVEGRLAMKGSADVER